MKVILFVSLAVVLLFSPALASYPTEAQRNATVAALQQKILAREEGRNNLKEQMEPAIARDNQTYAVSKGFQLHVGTNKTVTAAKVNNTISLVVPDKVRTAVQIATKQVEPITNETYQGVATVSFTRPGGHRRMLGFGEARQASRKLLHFIRQLFA